MALCGAAACNPVFVLPAVLARAVFARLPADARARAACVCRGWHDAVAEPSLWTLLDLSHGSGVTCFVLDKHLRAAAKRARGGLQTLAVTGRYDLWDALRAVVAENAATLRELSVLCTFHELGHRHTYRIDAWFIEQLLALISLAPALQAVVADAKTGFATARQMLRNEPPYELLRLRQLEIDCSHADKDIAGLVADMVTHRSLRTLVLKAFNLWRCWAPELDLLLHAACTLNLTAFHCNHCCPTPANAPALARLLRSSTLTSLKLDGSQADGQPVSMLNASAAALLANALRASCTLRILQLNAVRLLVDAESAAVLFSAVTSHVSLNSLSFMYNPVDPAAAHTIGAALGALVAADAPALAILFLKGCALGDAGLGPLVDALPRNTHLHNLDVSDNDLSNEFAEQRLLPAVRANTTLRLLNARYFGHDLAASEAEQYVLDREKAKARLTASAS